MSQARLSITPSDAWADQRLTPLQCRLLGLIGSYLGKDHRAWPAQRTLAEQLGVTRKAVIDGVKALKKYGYIEVEKRERPDGGQSSNCYYVLMDPRSRDGDTPVTSELHPLSPSEVTPPVTPEGDTHKKDPIERPNEDTVLFDEAWEIYRSCPLKARQKKVPARKAWAKAIKKADPEFIIEAIKQEVADRTNPKEWIGSLPDMQRWLRDEMWADVEFPTPEQPKSLDDWKQAAADYCELEIWPTSLGPAPHQPGCEAPIGLLKSIAKRMQGHNWHSAIIANIGEAAA